MPLTANNNIKQLLIAFLITLFCIEETKAQQLEGCVFLQGNYLEVGIAPNGAFGTPANAPAGYHSRPTPLSNSLYNPVTLTYQLRPAAVGFVADYGKDGWTVGTPAYFGDYFMPGTVQEGFTLQIDGTRSNAWSNRYQTNGSTGFTGPLTGSNTALTITAAEKKAIWQGTMNTLQVRQTIVLKDVKSYFTANIFLKNTGTDTLKNIYYMRTVDPDNEVSVTGTYSTKNKIAYQLPNVFNKTLVTAKGLQHNSYLGLGTKDCQARSFYLQSGLFPSADLANIYSGTPGYNYADSSIADAAIGLIFKIGNLPPGDSTTFSYAYILSEGDLDEAFSQTEPGFMYNGNYYPSGSVIVAAPGSVLPVSIINGDYYNWTWAPPTFLNTTTGQNVNATVSTGPVTYTVTGVSNGSVSTLCSNQSLTITISPFPVSPPPTVTSPVVYCVNEAASALAVSGPGIIRWYTTATGGVGTTTAPIPSTATAGTTTWYVTQESSGTESIRVPVVVNVVPLPTVTITSALPAICIGDSTMLVASGTPSTYVWTPAATLSAATNDSVMAFPASTTVYTVVATSTANGCKNNQTINLQVNPLPSVTVTPAAGNVCAGDSLQLTAGGAVSYLWNASPTLNTTAGPVVTAKPSVSTTYYVTGTDANKCKKQTTVTVVANPLPRPNLGADKSVCKESGILLSPGNFVNYLWHDNTASPTHAVNNIGYYWVKVENNFGCTASDTIRIISYFPNPENFLPGNTSFCRGNEQIINVPGYATYLWSDGTASNAATIKSFGQVSLTVSDFNGCYGKDSMLLTDANCIRHAVPNAFTPNTDGKNDVFKPFLTQIVTAYKMTVWNRWGEIVFSSTQPQNGWNGYYKTKEQPAGAYVYLISFIDSDGLPVSLKGTVNVIR